jgi:hypothetical protein
MGKRHVIPFVFAVRFLVGQGPDPEYGETAFRLAIQSGQISDPRGNVEAFALSHEDIAVPILLAAIKSKLDDPTADNFIYIAANLAVYKANERAVDTVAGLYSVDQKRFGWLVQHVLYGAFSRGRGYYLARYAFDHYPEIRGLVIDWVGQALKFQATDLRLAQEMLKREKPGYPVDQNDPLLSRLPVAAQEQIKRAIAKERIIIRESR